MADLTYPPVIAFAKAVFRGLGLRFDITGEDNVPRTGGAVMAINHVGYLDFTFAGLAARPAGRLVRFMAKKEVFDHKVSGPLMRGMQHIPVDRHGAAGDSYRAAVTHCGRRDRRRVPRGDHLAVLRAQGLQDRRGPDGAGGRRTAAAVRDLGQPARLDQGPARDLTRGTPIRIVVGEPFAADPDGDPVAVTADLKARMQVLLEQARATATPAGRAPPRTPGGSPPR